MGSQLYTREIVDGVHRFPQTGIKVVIVGAGPGGLVAALECWRKGHEVVVLERAAKLSVLGDCFTIGPSGLVSLDKYPKMHVKYNEKFYDSPVSWWSTTGRFYFELEPEWQRDTSPEHASFSHQRFVSFQKSRAEFTQMLLEQTDRLGIPVFWGRKVTSYEEDTLSGEARVRTESGEIFSGDLVVAADGVNTKSHEAVTGKPLPAFSSGYSISRVAFPRRSITPGSKGSTLLPNTRERPQFRVYLSDDMHLILMLNNDWCGIAFTHPDESGNADESWSNHISKEAMIDILVSDGHEWDPAVIDFLSQVPDSSKIVDWKLNWRDPQTTWSSAGGRIIQIGDSAHSFLPTSGNGAVQALEDALSLAECLRLGGKNGVPWSTKVQELLRFERVATIQKMGFINRERLHHSRENLEKASNNEEIKKYVSTIHHAGPTLWCHDAEKYATENFQAAIEHLRYGSPFHNTNIPGSQAYQPWTIEEVIKGEKELREASKNSTVIFVEA